jgi:hypothetical protein
MIDDDNDEDDDDDDDYDHDDWHKRGLVYVL